MDAARAGEGGVLVVQGPPGLGKTRLLAATADYGRSAGLRVLMGSGRELEREIASGVAVDLLTPPAAPLFPDAADREPAEGSEKDGHGRRRQGDLDCR